MDDFDRSRFGSGHRQSEDWKWSDGGSDYFDEFLAFQCMTSYIDGGNVDFTC